MWSPRLWRALAAHRTPLPLMVKHAYGRCPTSTQLSTQPLVTGHIWRRNTPQSPQKMGEGDYGRIPKGFCPLFDFGEEGRPSHDFSYFFHIFFYHRFLVSNCSKFCVKQMGSTVVLPWVIKFFWFTCCNGCSFERLGRESRAKRAPFVWKNKRNDYCRRSWNEIEYKKKSSDVLENRYSPIAHCHHYIIETIWRET